MRGAVVAAARHATATRFARFIAIGFGSGASPRAPGTAGSLAGLLIGAGLWWVSPLLLLAGLIGSTYAGLWAIRTSTGLPWRNGTKSEHEDPGWIVIDEIAGQMLAMMGLRHLSAAGLVAAFALFRFFDIAKPGPIGWADRQGGAAGIMADDLLAGAASALILMAVQALTGGAHS